MISLGWDTDSPHADFLMNMCQGEGGREILLT